MVGNELAEFETIDIRIGEGPVAGDIGQVAGDVSGAFAGNDAQVTNLGNVFDSSVNLDSCVSAPLDVSKYRVKSAYAGIGADISKVGVLTNLPALDPTPTGNQPEENWDLDNDENIDLFDFNEFVRKVIRNQEAWSNVASFIAAFRLDAQ